MNVYWLEQTEEDLPAEDDWLNASEMARLSGMRFPKRRVDWRLGRWTAKRALVTLAPTRTPVPMLPLMKLLILPPRN